MGKDTKIVHFKMIGGSPEDLNALGLQLKQMVDKTGLDIEFLVSNERVELTSVKYLLRELYKLYKNMKELQEKKK